MTTDTQQRWVRLLEQAGTTRHAPLLAHVAREALARGMSEADFTQQTGLYLQYLQALCSGRCKTVHLRDDITQAIARWLGWPAIAVKAMAGQVQLADFFTEAELALQPLTMCRRLEAPELSLEAPAVAVFAGMLAGFYGERRRLLRNIAADGPATGH